MIREVRRGIEEQQPLQGRSQKRVSGRFSNYGVATGCGAPRWQELQVTRLLRIKVVPVNGSHHLHHLPRGLLGFLVIFLQGPFHVAITAFHAQRVSDELHGRTS